MQPLKFFVLLSFLHFVWLLVFVLLMNLLVYIDKMEPVDVGLSPEMPYFRTTAGQRTPPITYLHLYENNKFSVCIFSRFIRKQSSWVRLLLTCIVFDHLNLYSWCRWEYFACLLQVSFHFTTILEWQSSASFSLGPCTSRHTTGWRSVLRMAYLRVSTRPVAQLLQEVSLHTISFCAHSRLV